MTVQQISAALAVLCPTVGAAVSFDGTTLTYLLWLDRATNQPSTVPQPTLAQLESVVLPSPPDWNGFIKWMTTAFDTPTLNAFAKAYPTMLGFCQFGNASGAQWCIMDGKMNLPLTSAQYALFQQANATFHLGMSLS